MPRQNLLMIPRMRTGALAAMLLAICVVPFLSNGAEEPAAGDLAGYYGFERVELYKLHQRSANLQSADLNGDGRTDLILVDNSNSRLDLLVQRDPKAPVEAASGSYG